MSIIIADASPLIALAGIDQLDLLQKLYETVLIPSAVKQELRLDSNMAGAKRLGIAMNEGWLKNESCEYPKESFQQLQYILDQGEVEAILLAECFSTHKDYRFLLIDERKGRKVAQKRGLLIAGTGVVLLAAKQKYFIDSVEEELDAMQGNGYRLSVALKHKLLEMAREA